MALMGDGDLALGGHLHSAGVMLEMENGSHAK